MKHMKHFRALLLAIAAGTALLPYTASAAIGISGDVTAKNQTGVHKGEVYRNYLKADVNLNENFGNTEVKVILRAEDDTLRPQDDPDSSSDYLRSDQTGPQRIYLREAYISHDFYFESFIDSINIKMGRVIYTWGNSDEVKPVDIINPQEYSNLYFTPLQERKYGVLSGSVSVFFTENFFIEAIAVPETRPSEIASSVFVTDALQTLVKMDSDNNIRQTLPETRIRNSSAAGRIGLTVFDIDMHASYYYGYDKLPVYKLAVTKPSPLTLDITSEYRKIQVFGFDFQRALLWGISVRGEGAYTDRGKYFAYSTSGASLLSSPLGLDLASGGSGSVEKKYVEYTAGFDDTNFIFDDLYLNLQFHQKIILDYDDRLSQEKYTNLVLWNIRYYMANQKYRLSSQGAYDTGDRSVYANAELGIRLAENFEFTAGGWILEGKSDTSIGQFDSNDMVYVSGKLTF